MLYRILLPQEGGECQPKVVSTPDSASFYRLVAGTSYDGPIEQVELPCRCGIDYHMPLSNERLTRDIALSRTHLRSV